MRTAWLVATLFLAAMMSGCLAQSDESNDSPEAATETQDGDPSQSQGSTNQAVAIGDDLGIITYEESDEVSAVLTQPDCAGGSGVSNTYGWTIPATNSDGIAWKARELTVTVTGSDSAIDLDLYLERDGEVIASATETGPDEGDSVTAEAEDVSPGPLTIRVQVCTSAAQASYDIAGEAHMVATEDRATTTNAGAGQSTADASDADKVSAVNVDQKTDDEGNLYYEASRTETYTSTLTGGTGTAAISTGGGAIDYNAGGGDDYKLVAELKARGASEQEARERLDEMYIDHVAQDGAAVALDVHGRAGGDGSWNGKQIDMDFDAPKAIDWATFTATAGGGVIDVDQVSATGMTMETGGGVATVSKCTVDALDVDTGGGVATVRDCDTDSLDVHAGGGVVTVDNTRANDMDLDTGGGMISAEMKASTASGSWDISGGGGTLSLNLVENSDLGYHIDATTGGGSVTFDFDEIEQTSECPQYGPCSSKEGETPNYQSRSIVVEVDMTLGGGSITASS